MSIDPGNFTNRDERMHLEEKRGAMERMDAVENESKEIKHKVRVEIEWKRTDSSKGAGVEQIYITGFYNEEKKLDITTKNIYKAFEVSRVWLEMETDSIRGYAK